MAESLLLDWNARIERWSRPVRLTAVGALVVAAAVADVVTGPDVTTTLIYSLCVVVAAWTVSRNAALGIAGVVGLVGWVLHRSETDVSDAVLVTNAVLHTAAFVLFALLTASVRRGLADLASGVRRDPLTGVLSRQGFLDELTRARERAIRSASPLGVVYFDLDDLKAVNDDEGHAAGDRLLRTFVERVGRHLRTSDPFGRLGGDEFAFVIERAEPDVIDAVVERVLLDPGLPSTSCGVAVFEGGYPPAVQMLAGADRRMYEDKQLRKGIPFDERP